MAVVPLRWPQIVVEDFPRDRYAGLSGVATARGAEGSAQAAQAIVAPRPADPDGRGGG